MLPLDPDDPEPVERAAYDAAYKGVTDALTLYLWRKPAFYLTRWAARAGIAPNFVTLVGAVLCVLAFFLFWQRRILVGVLSGFIFMVLDTVDGKLARVTGASSKWGEVFDHGIDLVHPPFWYWAWLHGLAAYGRPLEPVSRRWCCGRSSAAMSRSGSSKGMFIKRLGMEIHVWRPIDSKFRLITARRNPNMVILVAALLFAAARPRARARRLVDDRQPDFPCRAPGAGERARGARRKARLLARSMSWTAVVLAGSRPGRDPFAEQFGTDLKALIPVGGEPMVRRPVRALLASEQVGRSSCWRRNRSGSPPCFRQTPRQLAQPSHGTIAETISSCPAIRGLQWPLLVTTADHALLDARSSTSSARQAEGADVAIGVVERDDAAERASRRPSAPGCKFRGGRLHGRESVRVSARRRSPPAIELWRSVEQDRKKALAADRRCSGRCIAARVALRLRQPRRGACAARRQARPDDHARCGSAIRSPASTSTSRPTTRWSKPSSRDEA